MEGDLTVYPPLMESVAGFVYFEGQPVAGVRVHSDHQSEAWTDEAGRFEIEVFADRKVTLVPASTKKRRDPVGGCERGQRGPG